MQGHVDQQFKATAFSRETGLNPLTRSGLFDFHLILFIVFIAVPVIDPLLRYAKYTLPVITLLTLLISSRFKDPGAQSPSLRRTIGYFNRLSVFYLLLIAYSFCLLTIEGTLFFRFFAISFFILSPLFSVYFAFHSYDQGRIQRYLKTLFWGLILIFCLKKIDAIPFVSIKLLLEALLTSEFPSENHLAFHFGLLLVYFCLSKNFRYTIGSALMTILCFKRIVFPAVILGILAYYLVEKTKLIGKKSWYAFISLFVILNLIAVHLSYQFAFGQYDALILTLTDTSPNALFMGRQFLYSNVLSQLGGVPWFGIGIGKIDEMSFILFNYPMNLHSDLLKNYFEFGSILFALWIFFFYLFNSASSKMLALAIYMNTIFLTDNTFIYFDVFYVFYLLSGTLMCQMQTPASEKPARNHSMT